MASDQQSEKIIRLLEEQLTVANQQNQELTKQIESLSLTHHPSTPLRIQNGEIQIQYQYARCPM
ncbi:hypothetical protein ACA29_18780, partial [Lederbergia galactosidilytica]